MNLPFGVKVKSRRSGEKPPGGGRHANNDEPTDDGKSGHRVFVHVVLDSRPQQERKREQSHEQRHGKSVVAARRGTLRRRSVTESRIA